MAQGGHVILRRARLPGCRRRLPRAPGAQGCPAAQTWSGEFNRSTGTSSARRNEPRSRRPGAGLAGLSNKQIGERFHLSPKTVEKHIEHLMDKIGVPSRVEVAAAGQAAGVTPYLAA